MCINVFAERLLLLMKKIDYPGTQTIVSDLMFAEDKSKSTVSESPEDSGESMQEVSGGVLVIGGAVRSPETTTSSV